MLFAAGLGTRLAPLTDRLPKALVPVAGVPVLERVARRVVAAGADRLIINVHAFAAEIEAFVAEKSGFGVDVVFSHEPDAPLETGGGLRHAARHFRADSPAFLHNTDVLTTLPLGVMYRAHLERRPVATLAVHERRASRYLYFDEIGLCGRRDERSGRDQWARPAAGTVRRLAFCGVHVIEPWLPERIPGAGAFSIIDAYMQFAGAGHVVAPFTGTGEGWAWVDIGTVERLREAEELVADGGG